MICDRRGHYYLPIDIPVSDVSDGLYWSVIPPKPERKLYCRRCGAVMSLSLATSWGRSMVMSMSFTTTLMCLTTSSNVSL